MSTSSGCQADKKLKKSRSPLTSRVTMADVAQAAGVGLTTVSYALSGKGNLPENTREAVLQAARELGYESNYFAQNLKAPYRNVVALCAGVDLGIGTLTIWDLQHRLDRNGYAVEVHTTPMFVSEAARKQAELFHMVRRLKPRALICEVSGIDSAGLKELEVFVEKGGLLICFAVGDAPALPCDYVIYDAEESAYLATRYLLHKGHRKLGLNIHHNECLAEHPHVKGFSRALNEAKISSNPSWMWASCCYEDAGACLAQKFLALDSGERPSGICIINDVSASSFVNHITRKGVQVPQQVSVIGHDDTPAARHCLVPLTTISHPVTTMTEHLTELLLSRLEGRYSGAPRNIKICGEIIERQSVLNMTEKS